MSDNGERNAQGQADGLVIGTNTSPDGTVYMGQYNANSDVERLTKYVMLATSSKSGKAKQATFRPAAPTKKLLP